MSLLQGVLGLETALLEFDQLLEDVVRHKQCRHAEILLEMLQVSVPQAITTGQIIVDDVFS